MDKFHQELTNFD